MNPDFGTINNMSTEPSVSKTRQFAETCGAASKLVLFVALVLILADQVWDQLTKYLQGRTTMSMHSMREDALAMPSMILCPEPTLDLTVPYATIFYTTPLIPFPPLGSGNPANPNNWTMLDYWRNVTFAKDEDYGVNVYSGTGKERKLNFTQDDLYTMTR